jgi:exo-beta-1,3-glucanase (GH17 family)
MARHWRMIRMYGQGDASRWVAEIIREEKLPLKLLAGVWISAEVHLNDRGDVIGRDESLAELNRKEVAQAIALANEFPDVVMALGIGNETLVSWSTYRTSSEVLLKYLREVRAAVKQPITTCDGEAFWNTPQSVEIGLNCDFIAVHAYAMWNKQQLVDALSWTREQIAIVQRLHPDRPIVLTELGWATQKGTNGYQAIGIVAEPGERAQELFYRALEDWANEANQPYFYFQAFDEKWKGGDEPNEVEKHWGVFFSDRTPKLVMQTTEPAKRK